MLESILKYSGFYLDKSEHNIINDELNDMIEEIKILSDFAVSNNSLSSYTSLHYLRKDEIRPSSNKEYILENAQKKNDNGIIVNKLI